MAMTFGKMRRLFVISGSSLLVLGLAWTVGKPFIGVGHASEGSLAVPAAVLDEPKDTKDSSEVAVLAGGCFWGVQGVFQHVKGVTSAVSGYAGGDAGTAQYETVSTGTTGHAESVRITFDPRQVTYGQLLQIYFSVTTDPTTLNAQGPDSGTQYRSEIFTTDESQAKVANAYIQQLGAAHTFGDPIVTQVAPLKGFYPAEAYHQDYLTLHPDNPYIAYNDMPKVNSLQHLFPSVYKAQPVLVNAKS